MIGRAPFVFLPTLSLLLSIGNTANAQEPSADTGVLEVTLPGGSTFSINGTNFADRRNFEMKNLEVGRLYRYDMNAPFKGGSEVRRQVFLKGGWRKSRMPLSLAEASIPDLMTQTGHSLFVHSVAFSPDGTQVCFWFRGPHGYPLGRGDAAQTAFLRGAQGHGKFGGNQPRRPPHPYGLP